MNTNKHHVSLLVLIALVLLACSEPDTRIVAEMYPPAHQGGPGDLLWISEPAIGVPVNPAQWKTNSVGMLVANDNQPSAAILALSPDDGTSLRCVRVSVVGSSGHAKPPETPPAVSVWRIGLDDADAQQIAVASDDASNLGAYEHVHQIDACAGSDEIVDPSRFRYQASVFNEHGLASLPGLKVLGVRRGIVPKP